MSDFNPITLYFILSESLGPWFWAVLGLAAVLLIGIIAGFARLRRVGRSASRPLLAGVVAGLVAAVALSFVVPVWTLADPSALSAPIDFVALVPGAVVASLAFMLAARRCAARSTSAA